MTYRELLLQAELKLDHNDITLGEFEQMIAPLNREVDVLDKIKGYVGHIRNTGMGKKKSLEFIEKFIEGLKAESEE